MNLTGRKIEFARRECGRPPGGNARAYDFDIRADGECIGVWRRTGYERGYTLRDRTGAIIRPADRPHTGRIRAIVKGEFEQLVMDHADRIPSGEDIAQREREADKQDKARKAEQRKAERFHQLRDAAPDMLAVLERLAWLKAGDQIGGGDVEAIAKAIAKAKPPE